MLAKFLHPLRPRLTPPSWGLVALAALLLVPFVWLALFASPQVFDFCFGQFIHHGVWGGLIAQYNLYGHQFLGRSLALLPLVLVRELSIDYFYIYSAFSLLAFISMAVFCRWAVQQLLPTTQPQAKWLAVILLLLALVGNAPSTRALLYAVPSYFIYALPGLLLAMCFLLLYRALAAGRAHSWYEQVALLVATPIIALANEFSGLALAALVMVAFWRRLKLVPDAPEPVMHAAMLGLSFLGSLLLLFGPAFPTLSLSYLGSGILWSALFTPEFYLLRLPLPGVLGWFLFLAVAYRPELQGTSLSDRHRHLLLFTLHSLLAISFIAFAFGYLPNGARLPARAQNELFIVVVIALSVAFCLLLPLLRAKLALWWQRRGWAEPERKHALLLALVLAALSPALLLAVSDAGEVGVYRAEQRARLNLILTRAEPTVFVPPLSVQPNLLFDYDIAATPEAMANSCLAEFFKLEKLLPQPPADQL